MSESARTGVALAVYFAGLPVSIGIASYIAGRKGVSLRRYFNDPEARVIHAFWFMYPFVLLVTGLILLICKVFTSNIFHRLTSPWRYLHSLGQKHKSKQDKYEAP